MCKRRFEESYAREITATVSHHTTAQISQGWSKSKNTKLSSMGLPGFAERKLNELVSSFQTSAVRIQLIKLV